MAKEEQIKTFPSPRGDKLCQVRQQRQKSKAEVSFRPLAGISCVRRRITNSHMEIEFPSPRGDKLCRLLAGDGGFPQAAVSVPSRG